MIKYKTIQVPASTREIVEECSCDACGKPGLTDHTDDINWDKESYQHNRNSIRNIKGSHYPEGILEDETWVDLCPTCYAKVKLFIKKELGATFHTKENTY